MIIAMEPVCDMISAGWQFMPSNMFWQVKSSEMRFQSVQTPEREKRRIMFSMGDEREIVSKWKKLWLKLEPLHADPDMSGVCTTVHRGRWLTSKALDYSFHPVANEYVISLWPS